MRGVKFVKNKRKRPTKTTDLSKSTKGAGKAVSSSLKSVRFK